MANARNEQQQMLTSEADSFVSFIGALRKKEGGAATVLESYDAFRLFLERHMTMRGWTLGSRAHQAVLTPLTPADKAFQIFWLNYLGEVWPRTTEGSVRTLEFELNDHKHKVLSEDKALLQAAQYLLKEVAEFKDLHARLTRGEWNKVLPDALLTSFAFQIPTGPKPEPSKASKAAPNVEALEILQWYGLNLYIRAHPEAASLHMVPAKDCLRDRGTLEAVFEDVRMAVLPSQGVVVKDAQGLSWGF